MPHDELKENLSAYLDGELTAPHRTELENHLAACQDCRRELESLRRASTRFRAEGTRRAPPGLEGEVLGRSAASAQARRPALSLALGTAVTVAVLLIAGKAFKPHLSAVFNQVMGMISGAATSISSPK